MLTGEQQLLVVSKWHDEVIFRVSEHARTGRDLRLSDCALMLDLLKADPDIARIGRDKAALSRVIRAATLLHLTHSWPAPPLGPPRTMWRLLSWTWYKIRLRTE